MFEEILLTTDYLSIYEDDENFEDRKENLLEFKSILNALENDGEISSNKDKLIYAFDEAILSDDKLQDQKQSNEGVTLSTVHSVKGLEFDTVFVVAFENGIFPSYMSLEDNDEGEEERRIAYVAVTRAKNKLYLSTAKKRMLYGNWSNNKPSKFLLEFAGSGNTKKKYQYDDEYEP
jgi:DNA helicase-2/ATP-dependent DNA helicase PcrA